MFIAGIDPSIHSTALTWMELDTNINIIDIGFLAFSKRKTFKHLNVLYYDSDNFGSDFERNDWIAERVSHLTKDVSYVAFEDYSMNSKGRTFHIGEFVGNLKSKVAIKSDIKIRLYDPNTIKMFATGKGNAKKNNMWDSYKECLQKKMDLTNFPEPLAKNGVSPTSDIVDSYFICLLLREEILLRKIGIENLDKMSQKIMKRKTKSLPTPIAERDFVTYKGKAKF